MQFPLGFTYFISSIGQYGYMAIFLVSILEGPFVAVLSGFFASLGYFNIVACFFLLLAGDLIGDILYYSLGRWGGYEFMLRWGKYLGLTEARVSVFEKRFLEHDWKLILFAKTQSVGSAILFSAGAMRVPFSRYCLYNLLGSIPKIILFEAVGFYFAQGVTSAIRYIDYAAVVSVLLASMLLGSYFFFKSYAKSRNRDLPR